MVKWDAEKTKIPVGCGLIVGYASQAMPATGAFVIVKLPDSAKVELEKIGYPYTCISMPEVFLELL